VVREQPVRQHHRRRVRCAFQAVSDVHAVYGQDLQGVVTRRRHAALAAMAALTRGMTCSAINCIERQARAGSIQS
jgi:hypothetical protein